MNPGVIKVFAVLLVMCLLMFLLGILQVVSLPLVVYPCIGAVVVFIGLGLFWNPSTARGWLRVTAIACALFALSWAVLEVLGVISLAPVYRWTFLSLIVVAAAVMVSCRRKTQTG